MNITIAKNINSHLFNFRLRELLGKLGVDVLAKKKQQVSNCFCIIEI